MRVERHFGIGQVDEAAWRALEPPDFPFCDLEFLGALERRLLSRKELDAQLMAG